VVEAWETEDGVRPSASWQAVTRVNAEAAPKDTMRRPTLPGSGEGWRGRAGGGKAGKARKAKGVTARKTTARRPAISSGGNGEGLSWSLDGDVLVLRIPLGRVARRVAALQALATIKRVMGRQGEGVSGAVAGDVLVVRPLSRFVRQAVGEVLGRI